MKCVIVGVVSLVSGAVIGYFVGTKITAKKYKDLADKEVESVKSSLEAYYKGKLEGLGPKDIKVSSESKKKDDKPQKKNNLMDKDSIDYEKLKEERKEYVQYVKNYTSDTAVKEGKPEEIASKIGLPYIISDTEYAEGTYNSQTLHWYRDGVLCDDEFNVIKDVRGTVGNEALNSFGVYQEDAVYVRNDNLEVDYEILLEDDDYNRVAPKETIGVFPGDDED